MYGFRGSHFGGLIETAESFKNFNIIYTQKGSFLHKTTSEKVWLPRSDRDLRILYDTAEAFVKTLLALSSFKGIL
jgi:hypothetical protein